MSFVYIDQEDVHMTFIEKGMQRLRVVRRGSATDHQKGRHMGPIEEAPVNSKNGRSMCASGCVSTCELLDVEPGTGSPDGRVVRFCTTSK